MQCASLHPEVTGHSYTSLKQYDNLPPFSRAGRVTVAKADMLALQEGLHPARLNQANLGEIITVSY